MNRLLRLIVPLVPLALIGLVAVVATAADAPPATVDDSIDRLVRIVRDVGFPIVVAIYLLARIDPILRDLTKALNELVIRLAAIEKHMGGS